MLVVCGDTDHGRQALIMAEILETVIARGGTRRGNLVVSIWDCFPDPSGQAVPPNDVILSGLLRSSQ